MVSSTRKQIKLRLACTQKEANDLKIGRLVMTWQSIAIISIMLSCLIYSARNILLIKKLIILATRITVGGKKSQERGDG